MLLNNEAFNKNMFIVLAYKKKILLLWNVKMNFEFRTAIKNATKVRIVKPILGQC